MAGLRNRNSSRGRNRSRRLRVEPLEERMLLAVDSWPGFLIHDDEGDVFTVDPDNGMDLVYIDTTPEVLSDMAFSPEGDLYGVTLPWLGGVSRLYSFVADFEAATPSITAEWVRTITRGISGSVYVNSLGFNSAGELFAVGSKWPIPHVNPNFLFKIDVDTAEAEEILSLGSHASAGDLVFDSHDNMYLTTVSGYLLRVPPEQDSFEVVGPMGVDDFYGATLGPGPISYGFTWTEQAYQIDTATGDSTLLTPLEHDWLDFVNGAATIFPAPTDLGEVDFQELTDQEPTLGEFWYQVEAVRDGVLTVEVTNVDPAAEFDVTLYELDGSGNLDELETGLLRVDYEDANAGDVYYVQIANADSNFDLRVANLVQIHGVGNGAVVHGTDEDDTFTFVPGPPYLFTINDVDYSYNFRSTSTVVVSFDGGIGHDAAEITGSSSNDTATLNLGTSSGTVTRPSRYRVELAGTPEISFDGVGGVDSATLIGSDFADTIVLQPTWGRVTRSTSSLEVTAVENISVDGGLGDDTATFTGTTSDETAELGYLAANFAPATGTSFSAGVTNVETISAEAGGGYDTASFADSSQQDTFEATPQWASLAGTGFSLLASGYDQVRAESTHGGNDVALLRGQAGSQDTFEATPAYGKLTGTGFDNQASSFRYLHGYGTTGDLDVALLYGNPGAQDTFEAWARQAVLSGNGYYNRARSFRYVHGYSNTGGNDVALLHDSPTSNDTFQAWPHQAVLSGAGFYNRARSFRYVHGYGTSGNQDLALLHGDPAQQNTYKAWPQQAVLSGANYYNRARSFRFVHGYGTPGGTDLAYLYDDPSGPDLLRAWPHQSILSGAGHYNRAMSFREVYADATPGFDDVAEFHDRATGNDTFEAMPGMATMYGSGYYVEAGDFPTVRAYGSRTGNDQATLYDAPLTTDYLEAIGDWAELTAGDDSFSFYVEGFDVVTAYSTTPIGDIYNIGIVTYTLNRNGFWVPAW